MKLFKAAGILLMTIGLAANAQEANKFFPEKDLMTAGIYYYPEHWDPSQWARDIKQISLMGFEFVHLAEFAWAQLEPEEGKFNFGWLDKVIELCATNNLKVLMCTPSAATPAWMHNKYPETFIMYGNYIRAEHGTRGLGSIVNPVYRQFIERIVTEMAKRYGQNESVLLDFASFTSYPNVGQHNIGDQGFRLGNHRPLSFANDYYRNITGVTGIMELQPGPVNWGSVTPLLLPGAVRMWLWHCFGAGSSFACSYRFRQILYGAEQYFAGIIKTDGVTPSAGGEEYMQFIRELKELRKLYKPDSKMPENLASRKSAILWNHENFWSIDRQAQTQQWDAWGYPGKFQEILKSFGAPVDIVGETTDLSQYNFVIVPAYELIDSALVKKWADYATNGGNLVITCRTGTKDRNGHFWEAEIAAPVTGLIGARILATDMLPSDVTGEIFYKSAIYNWNNWADLLLPDTGTEVLAAYINQFYNGKAAVVKHIVGKGTVTYIDVDTADSKLEKDILREIFHQAGVTTEDYPQGVYAYWRDGFFIAVNYTSSNYTVVIPANAKILIGEKVLKPAGVVVWKE